MEEKKLLFIYNPHSGKGAIKNKLVFILDEFIKAGYEVTVYQTQSRGDATIHACERADAYDLLVCSGGDGTLDEVVKGVLSCGKDITLGYIPSGSTNDFAISLGLSSNMIKAASTAVYGKTFRCDIGMFNQSTFVYIAAFGMLTEISYETKQEKKNMLGHMAYVLEGMKHLGVGSNLKSYELSVTADDRLIKDRFIYGMITNSVSVGGYKGLTGKNVKLDDGLFEVLLIKYPEDPSELNSLLAALISLEPDPAHIYYFRASSLEIHSETPVAWTLDGENGGSHCDVEINNRKQAIEIMVP